jgi:hypothetical protein
MKTFQSRLLARLSDKLSPSASGLGLEILSQIVAERKFGVCFTGRDFTGSI